MIKNTCAEPIELYQTESDIILQGVLFRMSTRDVGFYSAKYRADDQFRTF